MADTQVPNVSVAKAAFGQISLWEKVHLSTVFARLAISLSWRTFVNVLTLSPPKTFKRTVATTIMEASIQNCWYNEVQSISTNSVDAYKAWAAKEGLPVTIENLIHDTTLLWIGPKRVDRVVLHVHGGAYVYPIHSSSLAFWKYVQDELKKNDGLEVGFAVLAYDLVPTAGFKQQLRQAMIALEHILATGIEPHNVHITGESAGGSLALGLLSHILHPLPGVRPIIGLKKPLGGAYLMSPWVSLKSKPSESGALHPAAAGLNLIADVVSEHAQLTEDQAVYIEAINAPEGWFKNLDRVVGRVLVTAGGSEAELHRNEIVLVSEMIKAHKKDGTTTLIVQEGGQHVDPLLDFFFGSCDPADVCSLTPAIISWLAVGYGR